MKRSVYVAGFERAFYEAARTLRNILSLRDPARRLRWNRITVVVWPEIVLDGRLAELLARRLAPATRHLGLEKVVVRLRGMMLKSSSSRRSAGSSGSGPCIAS